MAKAKAKDVAPATKVKAGKAVAPGPPDPHSTTRISNLDAAWASAYAEKAQRGDPVTLTNLIPAKGESVEYDAKGAAARVKVKRAARLAAKPDPRDAGRVSDPAAAYFDALEEERRRNAARAIAKSTAPKPAKAKATQPKTKAKAAGPRHVTKWSDALERMHRGFLPELPEEGDDLVEFINEDVDGDTFDTAPVALMVELVKLGLVVAPTSKWDDRAGWVGEAAYTLANLRPKVDPKPVAKGKLPRFMQPEPEKAPAKHAPKVSPYRDRAAVKTDREQLTPEARARIDADLAKAKGLPDPGYYSEQFTEL